MTLRALRDGINAAVNMIKSCCTVCDSCIRVCGGVPFPKLVADCYHELVDVVEDFFKSNLRQHGVPAQITNKIEWNDINPDEDVGVPKKHDQEFSSKEGDKARFWHPWKWSSWTA